MPLMSVTDAANNIITLVGSVEGVMIAFPAVNEDGTPNQPAQDAAIAAMVASLVNSGVFQLSTNVTIAQVQSFAPMLVKLMSDYKAATTKTIPVTPIAPQVPVSPAR